VKTRIGQCGYFTMEYVAGGSLDTFWRAYRREFVPMVKSVEIIRQVCMGLAVAHAEQPPIIHRDIKPQNILVGYDTEGLRIRIADFGLAKKANPLTLLASARGTPAFKPPECLSNVDSCATDVFAVGATLYLLLTDRLPFIINSRMDFSAGKCWTQPLVPASRFNARVDSKLDSIICRALELKASDRYPDAGAVLSELAKWKSPEPIKLGKVKEDADEHKSAMGPLPSIEHTSADEMVRRAFNLSRDPGKLIEAADLLEEALNKSPSLTKRYEYQLKLWRRGVLI
jgi:serine/threonine protein kinase